VAGKMVNFPLVGVAKSAFFHRLLAARFIISVKEKNHEKIANGSINCCNVFLCWAGWWLYHGT
jgi:hypothetical protein